MKLETLISLPNAIIFDLQSLVGGEAIVTSQRILTSLTRWIHESHHQHAFMIGDPAIMAKCTGVDHFAISDSSLSDLLQEDTIQTCDLVIVYSSITQFDQVRTALDKYTQLIYVPTETLFDIPLLARAEAAWTQIVHKRILEDFYAGKWWVIRTNMLANLTYYEHVSAEGYLCEIVAYKEIIMRLLNNPVNDQKVDDILTYLSTKYPVDENIMLLYGTFYHQKACRTRQGLKIVGPWVKRAEKAYKQALHFNSTHVGTGVGLALLYAQAGKPKKASKFFSKMPFPTQQAIMAQMAGRC